MVDLCQRCILDTSVPDIVFNNEGICNYCLSYDEILLTLPASKEAKQLKLEQLVNQMKRDGEGNDYDCILGVSGGVDSTYLANLAVESGLRPLLVHVDTGWNNEIAVSNIEKLIEHLKLDLLTVVLDWEEIKDLQRSYFLASVPDCDVPQDHAFPAVLNRIAVENRIKHSLSGHNIATEFILPKAWSYDSNDLANLEHIHRIYGKRPIKSYPKYSLFKRVVWYRFIKKVTSYGKFKYLSDIKSFYMESVMRALASVS